MRTYAFALVFFVLLSFSPIKADTSHAWMSMQAAAFNAMLEEIFDQIKGVMVNVLKQQAAKTLSQQVNSLIGGNASGESLIITDWQDYLIDEPKETAEIYINDYLSQITSGRGSSGNYIPLGSSQEGFGGGSNYLSSLKQETLQSIDEDNRLRTTYEGNPSQMFASGNFKNFDAFLSGINNPWAFEMNARDEYEKKLADEEIKRQVQGTANQGFESQGSEDAVSMPGSAIKDMFVNIEDLPNKILADATRPAEVVSALCSSILNKAISQGVGQVNKYINKTTSDLKKTINSSTGDMGQYYQYLNNKR